MANLFISTQLFIVCKSFNYKQCYHTLTIQINFKHLLAHSLIVSCIAKTNSYIQIQLTVIKRETVHLHSTGLKYCY